MEARFDLFARFGPASALRFLQQYYGGQGDYTQERHAWLDGLSLEEVVEKIQGGKQENKRDE
ncbi:MAG TPA: hypothetical protein PLT93_08905 [Phycisphaerae bacterium]|mgnify:FL=1|nr:hypothetical protein [Phycisphaerae bacterium]